MSGRTLELLDTGWKFNFTGNEPLHAIERNLTSAAYVEGPASRACDDSAWREVSIPHDFVVEGERTHGEPMSVYPYGANPHAWRGSYPTGVGWYRRHFAVPSQLGDDRIYLLFDGVFRDARVYLNEFFVGHHPSGYTPFALDLTDFVEAGSDNLVALRADAQGAEGWYYEGGGIYRPVHLLRVPPVHIPPEGVHVVAEVDLSAAPRA